MNHFSDPTEGSSPAVSEHGTVPGKPQGGNSTGFQRRSKTALLTVALAQRALLQQVTVPNLVNLIFSLTKIDDKQKHEAKEPPFCSGHAPCKAAFEKLYATIKFLYFYLKTFNFRGSFQLQLQHSERKFYTYFPENGSSNPKSR